MAFKVLSVTKVKYSIGVYRNLNKMKTNGSFAHHLFLLILVTSRLSTENLVFPGQLQSSCDEASRLSALYLPKSNE